MDTHVPGLSPHHQAVVERFVAACRADARVVAAFLRGSYVTGTADAWSDLDLGLVTTDAAYEEFVAGRAAFLRQLGEPLFLEDFDIPNFVFFVLADGAEGELALGREGDFAHTHAGPHRVLLDKTGVLAGAAFPWRAPAPAEQVERLRRLVHWFWHDLSHFITALARGDLWWAYGQLEVLRRVCGNLARLTHNFSDPDVGEEVYFKVGHALPPAYLAPLEATCCPLERGALLQAARAILRRYQELARPLAQAHGIPYPAELERLTCERLERASAGG
ncbi:MAG TPA: nucleotidyltransferase domain-containing protein [Roseiflexaceae bacterium]|nr:nucleotidyltransferase domain-containing protein [Roseiflexaceae bacterium]